VVIPFADSMHLGSPWTLYSGACRTDGKAVAAVGTGSATTGTLQVWDLPSGRPCFTARASPPAQSWLCPCGSFP